MNEVNRLWAALGKAIRHGASNKQINGIVVQLNRARGRSGS